MGKNTEPKKKNLTKEEYKAIRSLNKNKDIVIKPADKGSAMVILDNNHILMKDRDNFITLNFMKKQIQTSLVRWYRELTFMYMICYKRVNMLQKRQISQSTCNYLTTDIDRT